MLAGRDTQGDSQERSAKVEIYIIIKLETRGFFSGLGGSTSTPSASLFTPSMCYSAQQGFLRLNEINNPMSNVGSWTCFDLGGRLIQTFFFDVGLALAGATRFLAFVLDFTGPVVQLGLGLGLGLGMGLGLVTFPDTFLGFLCFTTKTVVSFTLLS